METMMTSDQQLIVVHHQDQESNQDAVTQQSRSVSTSTDEEEYTPGNHPQQSEPKFKDASIQQPSVRSINNGLENNNTHVQSMQSCLSIRHIDQAQQQQPFEQHQQHQIEYRLNEDSTTDDNNNNYTYTHHHPTFSSNLNSTLKAQRLFHQFEAPTPQQPRLQTPCCHNCYHYSISTPMPRASYEELPPNHMLIHNQTSSNPFQQTTVIYPDEEEPSIEVPVIKERSVYQNVRYIPPQPMHKKKPVEYVNNRSNIENLQEFFNSEIDRLLNIIDDDTTKEKRKRQQMKSAGAQRQYRQY